MLSLLIIEAGWSHTFLFAAELVQAGVQVHVLGGYMGVSYVLPQGLTVDKRPLPPDVDDETLMLRIEQALHETGSDKVLPIAEHILFKIWRKQPAWIDKLIPAIAEEERQRYLSKHHMTAFLTARGVAAPKTVNLADGKPDEVESIISELGLPVVVKAHAGAAGNGVHIAHSSADAAHLVHESHVAEGRWPALQTFVSGPTYLVGGAFLNGRAVRLVAAEKTEVDPAVTGPSIRLLTTQEPQLLEAARQVFRSLHFTGIASADFMRAANGEFLFLEVNPRPWGSIGVARHAGVDLIPAWVRILNGFPDNEEVVGRAHVDWVKLPEYLKGASLGRRAMLKRALSLVALRSWSWRSLPILLWEVRCVLSAFKRGKRNTGN